MNCVQLGDWILQSAETLPSDVPAVLTAASGVSSAFLSTLIPEASRLRVSTWSIHRDEGWVGSWTTFTCSISQSVQSLSCVCFFVTPWTAAHQASLSIMSRSLLKLMFIESVMPSNHLILCCPLLLASIFPSIRVFSNESVLWIRWPEYWSFSFSISLFNEYSGLISFRMDLLDLLAVQGTLKSLLQQHSSKASILQPSVICSISSFFLN